MKRFLLSATAAVLLASPLAAAAQPSPQGWASINQRQSTLDQRIDLGIRGGALTRSEASLVRGEFDALARLETQYRASAGGLSLVERTDLDRRFDALSQRIRLERNDVQDRRNGPWQSINQRQAMLDQRIDQGVRTGALTRREAVTLRSDFNALSRLEAEYRASGGLLSATERTDLDRRFDLLSQRIRLERNDRDDRGASWQSINQRQAALDQRIDRGVRNGALNAREAVALRSEFDAILRLETQYRSSGGQFSLQERADLDSRFDMLSQRIRIERQDRR